MLTIDGSYGESGGQILRTAVALAALTKKAIKITNIRKGRCNPGLQAQHLSGVKIAGEFCDASIEGLAIGSTEVDFIPRELNFCDKKINIGTAGSIALLLQTLLPILAFTDKKITIEIVGGTDGKWAPPILFFKHITIPIIKKLGADVELKVERFGFYPKGGGIAKVKIAPCKKLSAINLVECGELKFVKGISVVGSLPEHIAFRQAEVAKKILAENNFDVEVETAVVKTLSPGSSINLWAEFENTIVGANALGERGKKAEIVGEEVAKDLIKTIRSRAALDKHMSDQIIPYMALADGKSEVRIEDVTQHCLTNIFVTEKILGCKFDVDKSKKIITVDGVGFGLN